MFSLRGLDSAGTDRRSFIRHLRAAAIHRDKVDRLSIRELSDLLSVPKSLFHRVLVKRGFEEETRPWRRASLFRMQVFHHVDDEEA